MDRKRRGDEDDDTDRGKAPRREMPLLPYIREPGLREERVFMFIIQQQTMTLSSKRTGLCTTPACIYERSNIIYCTTTTATTTTTTTTTAAAAAAARRNYA